MSLTRRFALAGMAGVTVASQVPAAPAASGGFNADVDLLRRIYQTLHPGLYRYQTPDQFSRRCEELKASGAGRAGLATQYRLLSRLLAQVRCGHTYANYFNQSRTVSDALFQGADKLPFHFVWVGAHMVVWANPLGVEGLENGDEILSVDGTPSASIQATLLPYMRADGANDNKRRALLDVTGIEKFEAFDVFHALAYPRADDRITVVRRRPGNGAVRVLRLQAIDLTARRAMAPRSADDTTPDFWTLAWPRPSVAVLTMPGWAMFNVTWDWRARLAVLLDEIAGRDARGLIIDIRENEGGDDCGNEIIARLIDTDLPLFTDGERRVRFRSTPTDLHPYLDTWDRSFDHLGEGADDLGNGFFRLKSDEDALKRIVPAKPRIRGRVIVLSGPQNSSATFQFISMVRRGGLARIYGRPTGGNQRGINGGSFFFARLPGSGLEVDVPLVGFFPDGPRPDSGLLPDVWLEPTPEDVARGYDRALDRAITDLE